MKWRRLLLLLGLVVVAAIAMAVALILGPYREPATDLLRRRLETLLAGAIETPVTIGALRIAFVPPRVEVEGVALGPDGALVWVETAAAELRVRESLREAQPVLVASADGVVVDLPALDALPRRPERAPGGKPPRLRLAAAQVRSVRVQLTAAPAPVVVSAGEVHGTARIDRQGRLAAEAQASAVELVRDDAALRLAQAAAAIEETAAGLHLTALDVAGEGLQLRGERRAAAAELAVTGSVDLAVVRPFSPALADVHGRAAIDVVLAGPLTEPALTGTVRGSELAVADAALGELTVTLDATPERLTIQTADLRGGAGEAHASGTLQLAAPFAYEATVGWSALDPTRIAAIDPNLVKPFTAAGEASLAGTIEPLAVDGHGGGSFTATAGGRPITWQGQARYAAGEGAGRIEATQGTANRVTAELAIAGDGALDGHVDAAVADPIAIGALLPIEGLPNLTGSLTASARLGGNLDAPRVDGEVGGQDVVLLGVTIDRLTGAFTADRYAVRVATFHAELQPGTVDAAGTVALGADVANDFQAQATAVSGDTLVALVYAFTGTVAPIGRGTLSASARAHGRWDALTLEANATMTEFWLTQEWIQRAHVDVRATWPQWTASGELRNRSGQTLVVLGTGRSTNAVELAATSEGWQLTSLQRGDMDANQGVVTADVQLAGPLAALSGGGEVRVSDLILDGRRLGTIDMTLEAARGRWQIGATALDGTVELRATAAPEAGWPFTVDVSWREARLGQVIHPGADVWILSSGSAAARGRLTALAQATADAEIAALRLANGPYQLDLVAPATIRCRAGACTLDQLVLRGTDTEVRIAGRAASSGAVQATLDGRGDLRLLELIGPPIASARGRFQIDTDVSRRGGQWDVEGSIALEQVGLDVGAPVAITRAVGRMSLDGTTIRIDELGGRIGTGTFAVDGSIDLMEGPRLSWTLTDVGADLQPSVEAELSGTGVVEGSWERMRVAGDIRVQRMLYDRDIELTDLLPSFNRALAAAPRPPGKREIVLDLRITAPGELYVENNLARIEAAANLRITGTAQRPVIDGRVEALDGQITFRDRVFELQGATVDFRPDLGLTPALNITAESTVDTPDATYIVGIQITGTTADPRVALSSDDPGLSQTDLATLLAVGKTTAQLREGGGAGFSMYDALAIVPGQLTQPLTQRAQQLLPIDRISFEPTFSRTTGTFEPQLKLGKDLTDDLSVSIGQTFGVESRTLAEATYRLSPHVFIPVSWESQTQTQEGAFQAGVKLRYEFWRLTPFTLLRTLR